MIEVNIGLRKVGLIEEMKRCHRDNEWDRLSRRVESRVSEWREEQGEDSEVILSEEEMRGKQEL